MNNFNIKRNLFGILAESEYKKGLSLVVNTWVCHSHLNQGVREESCVEGCGERFAPLPNFSCKIIYKPWTNPPPEYNGIHIDHSEHLCCSFNLFLSLQYDNRHFYITEKSNITVWIDSGFNKNHSLAFLVWAIICASQAIKNLLTLFCFLVPPKA